jgi:hypothetical protein
MSADPMEQMPLSLVGGLVVEPISSTATPVQGSNITVDVKDATGKILFREFAVITQENIYLSQGVFNSINFGTEPMVNPFRLSPFVPKWKQYDSSQLGCVFSSTASSSTTCGLLGVMKDPQTPIFAAAAGTPVRFRMLHPDGLGGFPDDVWTIHGHLWQEEPYVSFFSPTRGVVPSATLGRNRFSQSMGSRDGFGPGNHFDILIDSAGGVNQVPGDYLYKSFPVAEASSGVWGVFRVCAQSPCVAAPRAVAGSTGSIVAARRAAAKAAPAPAPPDPGDRFDLRKQIRKQKRQRQQP